MKTAARPVNRIKNDLHIENGDESSQVQRVVIEASTYERVVFKLKGITPVMFGAWDDSAKHGLPDHPDRKPIKKGGTRTAPNPKMITSGKCYNHPEGGYAIPITMLFKALQTAGSDFTVPGSRRSVATVVRRNLLVIGDSKDGQWIRLQTKGYEIDERVGRNSGMKRSPRMIYRPRFDAWSLEVAIEYNTLWFDLSSVTNILAIAGKTVGIGEWRPEKGGSFGRFEVSHA